MEKEQKYLYSILTVITNNYEIVHEVQNPNPNVEYVLVTDDPNLTSSTWKIKYVKDIWFQYVRHHLFEFVSTDVCLWLDGTYQITDDPTNDFIMPFIESDKEMMISLHDTRTNVFDELCNWWAYRGIPTENIEALNKILIQNKMTGTEILFQASCYLVKNTESIRKLFETMIKIENACSVVAPYRDDQVIFSLCINRLYPNWDKLVLMDFQYTANNEFFHWCFHHSNQQQYVKSNTNRCWGKEQHLYKIGKNVLINF